MIDEQCYRLLSKVVHKLVSSDSPTLIIEYTESHVLGQLPPLSQSTYFARHTLVLTEVLRILKLKTNNLK